MKNISIIKKIILKKLTNLLAIFLIIVFVLSLTTNFLGAPKKAEAGILASGSDITITGPGTWLIDSAGEIKKPPSVALKDETGNFDLDYRYYSYLFDDAGYNVTPGTNLTLTNNATVLMEGTQKLANLTVQNGATITQPFPDRSGNINNKPLYANNYWAMRLTGYYRIPAGSDYYDLLPGSPPTAMDEGFYIEIGNPSETRDISDPSFPWNPYYSLKYTDAYNDTTWPTGDYRATYRSTWMTAGSTDKYVPIRITSADADASYGSNLGVKYTINNHGNDYAPRGSFFSARGNMGTGYRMNFEYFVADKNEGPKRDLLNAIRTSWANGISLDDTNINNPDDFDSAGLQNDYLGRVYGPNLMYFGWKRGCPLGKSLGNVAGLPYREASRYSAYPYNTNLVDPGIFNTKRTPGGLTLVVEGKITIKTNGAIDLKGAGYPGYANEFRGDTNQSNFDTDLNGVITPLFTDLGDTQKNLIGSGRGGSVDTGSYLDGLYHGKPGGGYSNGGYNLNSVGSPIIGTGGSHSGKGGFGEAHNNNVLARAGTYGDYLYPTTMGSGAGAGCATNTMCNIAGSGGGMIVIRTSNLTIDNGIIDVGGTAGKYIGFANQAGGAGGAINITTDILNFGSEAKSLTADGSYYGQGNYAYSKFVGGGAGYIRLEYNTSNKINSVIQSKVSVVGGAGFNAGANANGENGAARVFSNNSARTKKTLLASKRGGVDNTSFNPYALQIGDEIRVNIKAGSLNVNVPVTIADDILRASSGVKCIPFGGYSPIGGAYDSAGARVIWSNFVPTDAITEFDYYCKVQ